MESTLFAALNARATGLLPPALADLSVVVVGAGSVGSQMAEGLVRAGVGHLSLIDGDVVEAHNLSRTAYRADDVGKPKVACLAAHMRAINPDIEVAAVARSLQDIDKAELTAIIATADLILASTDDPHAQVLLNRISQHSDTPALFVGLYKGAKGGEVVLSAPRIRPCFECYAGSKRGQTKGVERTKDYGTGRLTAEPGLGADIAHVTSAATKLALSLLAVLAGDGSAREFVLNILDRDLTVATFGMEPDYWFYPQVFHATPGQFAFQSVWLDVKRNADCPACGPKRDKADPIWSMTGPVDSKQFQEQRETETVP
jgi:molybdopterin/thiamine biosynthesis adenylyltransferase